MAEQWRLTSHALQAASAVILVEGPSDRLAVEAAARMLGRDLHREGVGVVAMGGATNIRRHLAAHRSGVRVAGLFDASAGPFFLKHLRTEHPHLGETLRDMESVGFYACTADLEDELVRALTPATAQLLIEQQGDLAALQALQFQPAWRSRPVHEQIRRFLGSGSGRKIRYAPLFVQALAVGRLPRPLTRVLGAVGPAV